MKAHDSAVREGNKVFEFSDTFLAHREGVVLVIEVFLDESGTHENSPIMSVSAVWASKEVWSNWTVDWIKAKAPIQVHHSTDCHNRSGEYDGWSREQRDAYVRRILPVVRDNYIEGHFAAVDTGEIAAQLKDRFGIVIPPSWAVEGYYSICLEWALRSAWSILDARGVEQVAFIHETNNYSEIASKTFRRLQSKYPKRSATFGFGSKRAYPPLQCADVIAFEGNRQMRGGFQTPRRKPLQAIDPIGNRFGYLKYDKSEVGQLVDFSADYLTRELAKDD